MALSANQRIVSVDGMILALALSCCLAPQSPAPDLTKTLEPALAELVVRHRLPGLAIGVVRDGRVIYARGFGEASRGSGKPITTQSIFHMASVSKPFTATAAMQLVEAGKLDLDAPLTEYLPYFRLADQKSQHNGRVDTDSQRLSRLARRSAPRPRSMLLRIESMSWEPPGSAYRRRLANQVGRPFRVRVEGSSSPGGGEALRPSSQSASSSITTERIDRPSMALLALTRR